MLLATNCRCDQNEQPYTPFGRATATLTPAVPAPSSTAAPALTFTRAPASIVDPPARESEVSGRRLRAPEGFAFSRVLSFGRTGSPQDALAWLVPGQSSMGEPPGELYAFPAEGAPRKLSTFPGFVPTLAGCQHEVSLTRTGHQSATLDVRAHCPDAKLPARTPTRAVLVVVPERHPAALYELRLAEGAADESFDVSIESTDADSDGHDDVTATFSLFRRNEQEAVEARMVWLSRAAGVGRDASTTANSFAEQAGLELVRASGPTTSERVTERVQNLRRLMAHLCGELSSPRVSDEDGRPLDCGDLSRTKDTLAQAEVEALLTRGLTGEALLAARIADWYGPLSAGALEKQRAKLDRSIPEVRVAVKRVAAEARDPGPSGTFSPLAFASDGSLLVQTTAGVVRAHDDELASADAEVDPWPLVGTGPHGERFFGLSLPCEKPLIEIHAQTRESGIETLLQGRWLAPRPSSCSDRRNLVVPEVRVVRWDERGLGVLFGSVFWGSEQALLAPALGSPVSANGEHWVGATTDGLFIQHPTASERWTAEGLDDARLCVIANDGRRVACVAGRTVLLLERGERPPLE